MKVFCLVCVPHLDGENGNILHTVHEVNDAINAGKDPIFTRQVCTVSTSLFAKGYRIYVIDRYGKVFEITLGKCERTDKEIRMTHNIAKMLENGAFGDVL